MLPLFALFVVNSISGGMAQSGYMKSNGYPWVYPGDFNERIVRSDVVVSGEILSTVRGTSRVLDGVQVKENKATISIDHVFKGAPRARTMEFCWFSSASDAGVHSGPPLSNFRRGIRYLVFLRDNGKDYVVTIPLYAIEVRLAPVRSPSAVSDLSQASGTERNWEIARELENTALSFPEPSPDVTGEAATYFPYVVDLIGGCAEPFLWRFVRRNEKLDTPPTRDELRTAAQTYLALIANKRMKCTNDRR